MRVCIVGLSHRVLLHTGFIYIGGGSEGLLCIKEFPKKIDMENVKKAPYFYIPPPEQLICIGNIQKILSISICDNFRVIVWGRKILNTGDSNSSAFH